MLRRSFLHLPGVGHATEKKLWEMGILSWDQLQKSLDGIFKPERARTLRTVLEESESAFKKRDLRFFSERFPKDALWRLVPETIHKAAFLDIETTGLGFPPTSRSTTVTFYFDGKILQEHEPERKLALIRKVLSQCSMIVSFFGEAFDVPFLEREFGIAFDRPHIDLCFWLKRRGFRGGLKKVQRMFPDIPDRTSMDIDGFDAVRLWKLHERGISGALETLLTYNAEDTVVLEPLLVHAYNLEVERHESNPVLGPGLRKLPVPTLPGLPTRIDPEVYRLLRKSPAGASAIARSAAQAPPQWNDV